jgi:plastocyanin
MYPQGRARLYPGMIETDTIQAPVRRADLRSRRPRRGWTAVTALGGGLLLLLVAAIHALVRAPIPPLLAFAVVAALVLALLARGAARPGGVLALLLGAFLLSDVPAFATGLSLSRDPWEFTTTVTALTASILMVLGGGALAVRGTSSGRGRTTTALLVLGLVAVPAALASSLVLRLTMDQAEPRPGDVTVAITEFAFPERLTAPAGTASFSVRNDDPIAHTFTVEGLDVDAKVPGGATVRVTGELAPGRYAYVCRVSGHEFMRGTLVVE